MCDRIAFEAPPHRLDVLLLKGTGPFVVLVHSPKGRLLEVERWLTALGPSRIHSGNGLDPRVLRAEFKEVPPAWESLLDGASTCSIHLSTAGIATLFLEPGEDPPILSGEVPAGEPVTRVRGAMDGPFVEGLTDRQIDALSLAVSLGYYEVPHRVSQRELAKHLDMSLSGLSRLLRRAEATVITAHMDTLTDAGTEMERFDPLMRAAANEPRRGSPLARVH